MIRSICSAVFLICALHVSAVTAQVPDSISYQGYLEQNGSPVNDLSATLTFRLHDDPSNGTILWTETQTGVAIENGVFSVILGTVTDLFGVVFDEPLWLSVAVGDASASPLSSCSALTSVPYARSCAGVSGASNVFPSTGNVGVGTTEPSTHQHIHGSATTSRGQLSLSAPLTQDVFFSFYEGDNFKAYLWYDDSDDDLRLQNVNDFLGGDLSLNPYGGNVGVGTSAPAAELDVAGVTRMEVDTADAVLRVSNTGSGHGIEVATVSGNGVRVSAARTGLYVGEVSGDGLYVSSATADGVYIHSADDGMQVANATYEGFQVDIAGRRGVFISRAGEDGVYVDQAGTPSQTINSALHNGFEVHGAEGHGLFVGRADVDGVHVNAAGGWAGYFGGDVHITGNLTVDGTYPGGFSDRRLKTNIRPASNGLREVLNLRPVDFEWKERPDEGTHVGLIAQDVESVIPEVVTRPDEKNSYYGLAYTELVPVLIKAIQEQQAEIEALRIEMKGMQAELASR